MTDGNVVHQHMCAVINTELNGIARGPDEHIRILDVGFGNGKLLALLMRNLPKLRQDLKFEFYGIDVSDSRVQQPRFFEDSLHFLSKEFPDIEWNERLSIISSREQWIFPDNFFTFVISNQVLEHVFDHSFTFEQIKRVLANDGVSIHIFPLANCFYEAHLQLPFVHWISNKDLLFAYIKLCSRLGLGRYKEHKRSHTNLSLDEYCSKHVDYIIHEVNYLSLKDLFKLAKTNRFGCSFRYTGELYWTKVRMMINRQVVYIYSLCRNHILERLLLILFIRISSITLILDKTNTYSTIYSHEPCQKILN